MKSLLLKALLVIVQFIFVLAAGYVSFEWLMRSMVHARKEVEVPDFSKQGVYQVLETASKLGLSIAKESQEHHPELPAGVVVKQYPLPGSKVREGRALQLVLSLGSEKISIPELVGLPLRKAEIELKIAQLSLGEVHEIYSLKQPRGYVLVQEPKPLTLAEKGDLVHVTVSLGAPPSDKLIVPDFVGKDSQAAIDWAKANHMTYRTQENWQAQGAWDGMVVIQSLKPDTVIDRDQVSSSGMTLELQVARQQSQLPATTAFFEYAIPEKPLRSRDVLLKTMTADGEREVYRGQGNPGEKIRVPLIGISNISEAKMRIYLDGVLTEEKTLQ